MDVVTEALLAFGMVMANVARVSAVVQGRGNARRGCNARVCLISTLSVHQGAYISIKVHVRIGYLTQTVPCITQGASISVQGDKCLPSQPFVHCGTGNGEHTGVRTGHLLFNASISSCTSTLNRCLGRRASHAQYLGDPGQVATSDLPDGWRSGT